MRNGLTRVQYAFADIREGGVRVLHHPSNRTAHTISVKAGEVKAGEVPIHFDDELDQFHVVRRSELLRLDIVN